MNRDELGTATLEGPGSEARLRDIQRKFRKLSGAGAWTSQEKAQLGLGLWLIAWATCVGIATTVVLAKLG